MDLTKSLEFTYAEFQLCMRSGTEQNAPIIICF